MATSAPSAASPPGPTVSGKAIVIPVAILLLLALAVVAVHEWQQLGDPATTMSFARLEPGANATGAHLLTFDAVHKEHEDPFLEDHLDTAVELGESRESEVLRIERMQATLEAITGHPGPSWLVTWRGVQVQVEMAPTAATP